MAGGAQERPETWYRPLLWLYGTAVILSNPMIAFGLFYITLAVWIVLVYVSLHYGPKEARHAATALLVAVLVWLVAVGAAFAFLLALSVVGWYLAELASIALAAWVVYAGAASVTRGNRRAETYRRLGLGWGVATALLVLMPFATNFVPEWEAAAIFNPFLFLLPYLIMLLTAAISVICFALVPVYARLARSAPQPI